MPQLLVGVSPAHGTLPECEGPLNPQAAALLHCSGCKGQGTTWHRACCSLTQHSLAGPFC